MTDRRLRSLYICYLSLDDPLTHTQVVAYLRGLAAAGHRIHLLTFETSRIDRAQRRRVREAMATQGIAWHGLRYHKRPSLPATVFDVLVGAVIAALLCTRHRLDALHARSHVPAAMALIARRLLGRRAPALIFDIRGLMAEEYVDAGRWDAGGIAVRLTKGVERRAIDAAAGTVVLTERVRKLLFGSPPRPGVFVIPCCADLAALSAAAADGPRRRAELDLERATVMVYVGKFGGWYMADEMARFFAFTRRRIPAMHFLILTQAGPEAIQRSLAQHNIADGYTITSATPEQIGGYLAVADFGISFIQPAPSKISSSPTKVGEYLGSGLPVLATAGVGDLDELITAEVGVLVGEHSDESYRRAAARLDVLLADPDTRLRCRRLAERELSLAAVGIPRYDELYRFIATSASAI